MICDAADTLWKNPILFRNASHVRPKRLPDIGVNTGTRSFVLKTQWMFRHEKVLPIWKIFIQIRSHHNIYCLCFNSKFYILTLNTSSIRGAHRLDAIPLGFTHRTVPPGRITLGYVSQAFHAWLPSLSPSGTKKQRKNVRSEFSYPDYPG
jgi:hypothetical protein